MSILNDFFGNITCLLHHCYQPDFISSHSTSSTSTPLCLQPRLCHFQLIHSIHLFLSSTFPIVLHHYSSFIIIHLLSSSIFFIHHPFSSFIHHPFSSSIHHPFSSSIHHLHSSSILTHPLCHRNVDDSNIQSIERRLQQTIEMILMKKKRYWISGGRSERIKG